MKTDDYMFWLTPDALRDTAYYRMLEEKPKATQVGGDHYTKLKIQPIEYAIENGLDLMQHAVIKYVTRHKDKNGLEDIRKAVHYLQFIAEHDYGEKL